MHTFESHYQACIRRVMRFTIHGCNKGCNMACIVTVYEGASVLCCRASTQRAAVTFLATTIASAIVDATSAAVISAAIATRRHPNTHHCDYWPPPPSPLSRLHHLHADALAYTSSAVIAAILAAVVLRGFKMEVKTHSNGPPARLSPVLDRPSCTQTLCMLCGSS